MAAYESVAGVHGVAALALRNADNLLAVEVCICGADVDGVGRGMGMLGQGVRLGVDGGGLDPMRGGSACYSS